MIYTYNYKRDKVDERDLKFSSTILPHTEVILPKTVDLRHKCPPVYDQGDLGSCTANAGCTCRYMLFGNEKVDLSRMFLYYTERSMEGSVNKDDGACLRDTCKSIYKFGVCEEKYMSYNEDKYKKPPSRKAYVNASNYKIIAYKSMGSLGEIKQSLAFRQQPVLLGMDVYESFESDKTAKTGIMNIPTKGEKKLGGHAVLVVGYNNIKRKFNCITNDTYKYGYLIVRNSWGSGWGDGGYFYMPYDYVTSEYTFDYWIME